MTRSGLLRLLGCGACTPAHVSLGDLHFTCVSNGDCGDGLECVSLRCQPEGTAPDDDLDAGSVPRPYPSLRRASELASEIGYGAQRLQVQVPEVARGELIVLEVFARYSSLPVGLPTGFITLSETHDVSSAGVASEPRHVLAYRSATGNEDGLMLTVNTHNTATPPSGDLALGRSAARVYILSKSTPGASLRTVGGLVSLPPISAPAGSTVFSWFIAAAGTYLGVAPTSQGAPTAEMLSLEGGNLMALFSLPITSEEALDGGQFTTGGGAFRQIISIPFVP